LEELVKLGPTATNDQDDSERLVRYLTCQSGSKEGDDVVVLPVDRSELPDTVWAMDQPDRSLEYRYNWKRDLESYREEAPKEDSN
jgi:hypothetical protein